MRILKQFPTAILLIILLSGVINPSLCVAQEKSDVIVMLNGDRKEGKVLAVSEGTIKFKYSGEDLEYEIKKNEINKILFASGRTEMINEASQSSGSALPTSTAAERKNKIAVLPFDYVTNDESIPVDAMREQIQADCIKDFNNLTSLTVIDPMTINAMLAQNNITFDNYKTITPKDMAAMLGAEYVVYGTFHLQNEGVRTTNTAVTTYKEKEDKNKKDDNKNTRSKGTAVSSGSSYSTIDYDSKVDLSIYRDTGENIYSQSKEGFSGGPEAYHSTLNYIIKRSPFGSKHK